MNNETGECKCCDLLTANLQAALDQIDLDTNVVCNMQEQIDTLTAKLQAAERQNNELWSANVDLNRAARERDEYKEVVAELEYSIQQQESAYKSRAEAAEAEAKRMEPLIYSEVLCCNCNDALDKSEANWCQSCHIGYTELQVEVARLNGSLDDRETEIHELAVEVARHQETIFMKDGYLTGRAEEVAALRSRIAELERFANRFLCPEEFGYSVTAEVRDAARDLFGIPRCETGRR